jgi:glycosyltransferase involved in cell wall biosynthesis
MIYSTYRTAFSRKNASWSAGAARATQRRGHLAKKRRAPRVSVVITTFNRCALLCVAIDSVLAQDFPADEREIIVVDDGSTDDTRRTVEQRYGGKVRYIYKENAGINAACMTGFDAATADIVAQLDSDDYWYPSKLSICVPLFERSPDVVAVIHDLDRYKPDSLAASGTSWQHLNVLLSETPCDGLLSYLDGHPIPATTSGSLWRLSALKHILPFPPGLWGFNDAYCIRNIVFYGSICAVKKSLGAYLVHTTNDSTGGTMHPDKPWLERHIRESRIMSDEFNRRCALFGRTPSKRRILIQKLALLDSCVKLRLVDSGKWPVVKWIIENELGIPALAQIQGIFNVTLPSRLAIFIKNKVIGRFVSLD